MDTLKAIKTRRSISTVRLDPIDQQVIEKLLTAGSQAPNHYKVRPWRFIVITGSGLQRLGDVMAESLALKTSGLPEEALEKERAKPLRAPVIIAVGVDKPIEPKISEIENICAAAAACQNILLAAHEMDLAAIWRTGATALDPLIKSFLGLENDQHLIAFIYIGYPESTPDPLDRPDFSEKTTWIG